MGRLSGVVDACLDNGGPVRDSFTADHIGKLPFGMFDIVANAVGYDAKPTVDQLVSDMKTLSRASLALFHLDAPRLERLRLWKTKSKHPCRQLGIDLRCINALWN